MLGGVLVIIATLCWAVGASFYGESLKRVDPVGLNFVRSLAAVVFLFFVALVLGKLGYFFKLDFSSALLLVAASVLGWAVGDTLYFVSLKFIGVSRTAPLTYAYPLFMIPMSVFFLHESFTANILVGTVAIISAVWLISKSKGSDVKPVRMKLGIAAAILAALFWAIDVTIFKFMMSEFDPIFLAFFKILVIIPFLALYLPFSPDKSSISKLDSRDIALAMIGGAIAVGLGDMIYLLGLSLTQANIAAPLAATTPMFAGIIAAVFLKEKLTLKVFLAMVLATLGAAFLMS